MIERAEMIKAVVDVFGINLSILGDYEEAKSRTREDCDVFGVPQDIMEEAVQEIEERMGELKKLHPGS